jgi:small nuclear ribonucleoprotein (snRNP)-like protein
MSTSQAVKKLITELLGMIDKIVVVKLVDGSFYEGKLLGIDVSERLALHLVLGDAKSSDGKSFHRVVINGSRISEIIAVEKPIFVPEEFASIISTKLNLPPGAVKIIREAGMVIVYDRYKITENGVEGAGGLASKLYSLYQEYIERKKRG